jgi:hypothetical protein
MRSAVRPATAHPRRTPTASAARRPASAHTDAHARRSSSAEHSGRRRSGGGGNHHADAHLGHRGGGGGVAAAAAKRGSIFGQTQVRAAGNRSVSATVARAMEGEYTVHCIAQELSVLQGRDDRTYESWLRPAARSVEEATPDRYQRVHLRTHARMARAWVCLRACVCPC